MRASRYPLQLSVRYRRVGDQGWRHGTTENISRSGVLFRAEEPVAAQTYVELRLALPANAPTGERAEVACRGRVVRTVSASAGNPWPGSAVVIEQYDFLPASAELSFASSA